MYKWLFVIVSTWWFIRVESNIQSIPSSNPLACSKSLIDQTLTYSCPVGSILEKFNFDAIRDLNTVETLRVTGINDRGPLITVPENICLLKQLKHLNLSYNQIRNINFKSSSSCLTQLEILDLSNNYLNQLPIEWISQLSFLEIINVSKNNIDCLPNTIFSNISNVDILDISSNNLSSFEFWLIQIKKQINYSNNPVHYFTNNYNVDLSNINSHITEEILFKNLSKQIQFDDSLFEMYNRCREIDSRNENYLMQAIGRIHLNNLGVLHWNCTCSQYYLQEYIVSFVTKSEFSTWWCSNSNKTYREMCSNQSSFNVMAVKPRLCKIKNSEPGHVPEYVNTSLCNWVSDLENLAVGFYNNLIKIDVLNQTTVVQFAANINQFHNELKPYTSSSIPESSKTIFQRIITRIEHLLENINTPINISYDSVSVLSLYKHSSINSYSKINQTHYSIDPDAENPLATITINPISYANLSNTDIYIFYYLPSFLFQLAQSDENIIIVSPIAGTHLPIKSPRLINMSFIDDNAYSSGNYSCVFWQSNHWNDTGCFYSKLNNRHYCSCNHTTSFALIFIPHKLSQTTSIPSIIIAFISIICFILSIILSIYRQAISFRYLSITNIFTLFNSIVLFLLLTVILIRAYPTKNDNCSRAEENLVLTTYFFLILTFASKTLLGICYFLTIFIFIQLTTFIHKWFYISFILIILIALIPTIVIKIIYKQWKNFFQQYDGVCWLNSTVIFRFISIPLLIFIGINLLLIFGITIRLCQYSIRRKTVQTNEKRLVISIMIWLALCVSLGIAWIFGPFLDLLVGKVENTSSKIKLWVFGIFIGLEGLWVLIVNMIFYINQKVINKSRTMMFNKNNK